MDSQQTRIEESEPPGTGAADAPWRRDRDTWTRATAIPRRTNRIPRGTNRLPLGPPAHSSIQSEATRAFRSRHFPAASDAEWNDWRWQLRNRFTTGESLAGLLRLSPDEREALESAGGPLPLAITPYYASLLDPDDPRQPIRRTVVPTSAERTVSACEDRDPLGEEGDSPVPGIVHRYPDRVLFLVTGSCAANCRYCTRSRLVGGEVSIGASEERWARGISYIEGNPSVRDVLISGGDPLTLPDDKLEWLLSRLRRIPHVEVIRIGTKVPVVLPQRVTPALVAMLRRFHPLWMSIHFTHPLEITPEVTQACARLADAGIPLGSQTVLLSGINDNVETMRDLVQGLMRIRVRPYYLYQCDPIPGSRHFRTPVSRGLEIIRGLRGFTSGYAVPTYVIDAPGGGGKIPLLPDYVAGRDADGLQLRNYAGRLYHYPDQPENAEGPAHTADAPARPEEDCRRCV